MSLSIVITNYNYAQFLEASIESAFSVKCKNKEIIIVDDGSTDNSRQIIEKYKPFSKILFKKNEGQYSAYNAGFSLAFYDWILFLDSDDILYPDLYLIVSDFMREDVSKIQFQSECLDNEGNLTGKILPAFDFKISPSLIWHWNRTTGAYPSSWGSGNIYSKAKICNLFPLKPDFDKTGDSPLIALSPSLGCVETVRRVCAAYRMHQTNTFSNNLGSLDYKLKSYSLTEKRILFKINFSKTGHFPLNSNVFRNNLEFLYLNFLLRKTRLLVSDSHSFSAYDFLKAIFINQPFSITRHIYLTLAMMVIYVAPLFFIKSFQKYFCR